MESKTPTFDAKLQIILDALVPHSRICNWKGKHQHCEGDFELVAEDIEFLKMFRVPPPNFCPTCRRIRRVGFMGSNRFFKRPCNVPGHDEMMISILPEECPFPVYDYLYFISDEFDPFAFGIDYQKDISPMETLLSLRKRFPMPSFLNRDSLSLNSDYSNGGRNLKNGYYAFGCFDSENVWYSNLTLKSKEVMDSRAIRHSEFVYNSLASDYVYKSSFIYFSTHITESMFLFDCRNCDYCFGCVNLRNKKYCVYNEQLSKEAYETFIQGMYPLSRTVVAEHEEKFWNLVRSLPMNGPRNVASENVSGVCILNSRDMHDVIEADNSEHSRHADSALSNKDSMDILFSGASHNLYSCINIGSKSSNVKFSVSSKFCTDSEFIFNSKNLSNCFMCFGLQNKSYCILNKQYEPEEYFKLLDELKTDMLEKGEYADGPDFRFSAQPYNFSSGHSTYPLTEEQVKEFGGYSGSEPETNAGSIPTINPDEVPETIEETTDTILQQAIICEKTGRPFRVIPTELAFHRAMKIPLPVIHPTPRMRAYADIKPSAKKYSAHCAKCAKEMETMLDPEKGFLMYCESCFNKEVN